MAFSNPSCDELRKILERTRHVAVVGCSPKPHRLSHQIAASMQRRGYEIIPIHPRGGLILGEAAYTDLSRVPANLQIDMVNVFRRSEFTPEIAREAVRRGVKTLWLQLGVYNEEAARIAQAGGVTCVMDSCWAVVHALVR